MARHTLGHVFAPLLCAVFALSVGGQARAQTAQAAIGLATSARSMSYRDANAYAGIMHAIKAADADAAFITFGDSTCHVRWVAPVETYLQSKASADMRIQSADWDDTSKDYLAWDVVQAGTNGERNITFGGVRSRIIPGADITQPANIDVSIKVAPTLWVPAATQTLAAHYGVAGARGWRIYLRTDGRIGFDVSSDGTAQQTFNSSVVPPGTTNAQPLWLRVTYVASTGAWTHRWSTDGVTWTTYTSGTGTAAAVFAASAQNWEIGGRAGTTEPFIGQIFEVRIRSDVIAATSAADIINPQPITTWQRATGRISDSNSVAGSPTLYLIHGCMPGAGLTGQLVTPAGIGTYLLDNESKMLPPYQSSMVILSDGHNEGSAVGKPFLSAYSTWVSAAKARLPYARIVALTENPETGGIDTQPYMAARMQSLLSNGQALGIDVTDTYGQFFTNGVLNAALIDVDNIHPSNPAGVNFVAGEVIARFKAYENQ